MWRPAQPCASRTGLGWVRLEGGRGPCPHGVGVGAVHWGGREEVLKRVFPGLFQKELQGSVSSPRVKNLLTHGEAALWRRRNDFQGSGSGHHLGTSWTPPEVCSLVPPPTPLAAPPPPRPLPRRGGGVWSLAASGHTR